MSAEDTAPEDTAPESIDVPSDAVGQIIGRAGGLIKRLMQTTGCKIEIPKDKSEEGTVAIKLEGSSKQRQLAANAIKDICKGGDAEDHAARAEGAMVLNHDLEVYEKRSWLAWRLVPTEAEFGVKVDMGRKCLRIWAKDKKKQLYDDVAAQVREIAVAAIAEAADCVELTVDGKLDLDPDGAMHCKSVQPLVEQHGVSVWAPRPEGGVVPIRIVGPPLAARDVALMLEMKYVKGHSTASVLAVGGMMKALEGATAADFRNDLKEMETECKVKVHEGHAVVWCSGINIENVANSKQTLRDMMSFYFPKSFHLLKAIKKDVIEELRTDEGLRMLSQKPNSAIAYLPDEGSVWICGDHRSAVEKRINELVEKWNRENWHLELADYGVAMWLLGPGGTGDFMGRMAAESGAKIQVCPNTLMVKCSGNPQQLKMAEKLVLEGIKKLEEKKKADADILVEDVADRTSKRVLSDHPPHMRAILEAKAWLEARDVEKRKRARIAEWDGAAPPPKAAAAAGFAEGEEPPSHVRSLLSLQKGVEDARMGRAVEEPAGKGKKGKGGKGKKGGDSPPRTSPFGGAGGPLMASQIFGDRDKKKAAAEPVPNRFTSSSAAAGSTASAVPKGEMEEDLAAG